MAGREGAGIAETLGLREIWVERERALAIARVVFAELPQRDSLRSLSAASARANKHLQPNHNEISHVLSPYIYSLFEMLKI